MPMCNNDSEIASSEWFARKRMRITTFQVGFRITMCVWSMPPSPSAPSRRNSGGLVCQ